MYSGFNDNGKPANPFIIIFICLIVAIGIFFVFKDLKDGKVVLTKRPMNEPQKNAEKSDANSKIKSNGSE
ncbi:MAG: hypothetical protein V4525_15640 [Pseudomonadota bacterium]